MTGEFGFDFWQKQEISHFFVETRPSLGPTQPPIEWVQEQLSPGVKRPGPEFDHSLPSDAEVKDDEAKPPLLHTSSWLVV
jgi:hypothetical protein